MNKTLAIVVVVLLVILGGLFVFNQSPKSPSVSYSWQLTDLTEDPEKPGIPQTDVTLMVGERTIPLGTFDGPCTVVEESEWPLLQGEKSGAICWWAGGGSEVGVFLEYGHDVVKVGQLDEGSSEISPTRGNFVTIVTL